jgi:hypothetical protein
VEQSNGRRVAETIASVRILFRLRGPDSTLRDVNEAPTLTCRTLADGAEETCLGDQPVDLDRITGRQLLALTLAAALTSVTSTLLAIAVTASDLIDIAATASDLLT